MKVLFNNFFFSNLAYRLHRDSKFKSTLTMLFYFTALFSIAFLLTSYNQKLNASLEVDFAAQQNNVKSLIGILHGASSIQPPESTIKPLNPRLWRVGKTEIYKRVTELGTQFQLVVSDTWSYSANSTHWPYEDYNLWEAHLRKLAQENRNKQIIWDIWNEPNHSEFWKGTREQFFETYKRAYKTLRTELGSEVMIGGPSLTKYDKEYIKAFLEYCKANKLEVNFLSWHELNDRAITLIEDHLTDAQTNIIKNPAYKSLNIKKLYINEIIGPSAQYKPGGIIGYFYYLEKGRADGACKACWPPLKKDEIHNCSNKTLDGLLTPNTFKPRAAWWTYKAYADGITSRVQSQSNSPLVVALASSSNPDGKAQVILGYFEQNHSPPTANVSVTLKNLHKLGFTHKGQRLHLKLEKIPNTDEQVVQKLISVKEENVSVINGTVKIIIPNFGIYEGYLLTINKLAL